MELGKKHLGIGVAIILVVGLAFTFPSVISFVLEGNATIGEANCSINLQAVGYKDGEPVTAPLFNSPFTVGGASVDSIVLTISWVTSGSGVDWSTFVLEGDIIVKQLGGVGTDEEGIWSTKYSSTWSSTEKSGNYSETLVFGTDICKGTDIELLGGYGDYADMGWALELSVPVSVDAVDGAGIPLHDTVSPKMVGTLDILWDSSLDVEGSWSWDY